MIRPERGEQGGACLIARKTKSESLMIKALETFLEQVINWSIVGGTEKNGLPSIAMKHHTIKRSKIVKAWLTSHLQKPARREVKSFYKKITLLFQTF